MDEDNEPDAFVFPGSPADRRRVDKSDALERIASALERIADQGDDIEQHLSLIASVSSKFRDAAIERDPDGTPYVSVLASTHRGRKPPADPPKPL